MGQQIDLSYQVQGILPAQNGGIPASLAGLKFADNETPSGTVDGSNSTFTLANVPAPGGSLLLFFRPPAGQGVLYFQTIDYTLSGQTINTTAPPTSGGNLRAWYRFNQTIIVVRFEIMTLTDAFRFIVGLPFVLSDSMGMVEAFSFAARPTQVFEVERLLFSDGVTVSLSSPVKFSDAMTLSDGFASVLV